MENMNNTFNNNNNDQKSCDYPSYLGFALFEYRDQLRIRNQNYVHNYRNRMPITKKFSRDSMTLMKVKLWLTDELCDHSKRIGSVEPWEANEMKAILKERIEIQIEGLESIQQEIIERAESGQEELLVDLNEGIVINPLESYELEAPQESDPISNFGGLGLEESSSKAE